MQQKESLAYKAGRAFARSKPISPTAFAVGGIVGWVTLSMIGVISGLLANLMLTILFVAIAWEFICRAKP